MFAITGITGNVGGEVARNLLAAHLPVRAIVRNADKAQDWAARGCEIAVADILDSSALGAALNGAEAVFVLVPPVFDPSVDFSEAHSIAASLRSALASGRPDKVVYLSTIGAQVAERNLLSQHTMIEAALKELSIPITFLRPAWFMENAAWDVAPAREKGVVPSFLLPLDRPIPMVATADIGKLAAKLLRETWTGNRVVELEGPHRVTPNEIASTFGRLLGRPVRTEIVPHETWEDLFRFQGTKNPEPRIRMLDGFNEGWIEFENGITGSRKGETELETVLKSLIAR